MSINQLNNNLIYDNSIKKESNDLIYSESNDNLIYKESNDKLVHINDNKSTFEKFNHNLIDNPIKLTYTKSNDNNSINNMNKKSNDNNSIYNMNKKSNDNLIYNSIDKSKESNDNNSIYDNLIYNSIDLNPINSTISKLSFKLNDNSLKEFNHNLSNDVQEDSIDKLSNELNDNRSINESSDTKLMNKSGENILINESGNNKLFNKSNRIQNVSNDNEMRNISNDNEIRNVSNDNETPNISNDNQMRNVSNDNGIQNVSNDNKLINEQSDKLLNKNDIKRKLSEKLNIEIKLEILNSNKIYELNDTIDGILKLKLNKNLNSNLIRIKLKCVGEVEWQLPNCDLNSNLDNCLKEQENFLNTDYNVEKNYKSVCEIGDHIIPFNFRLIDKKLPPTFREQTSKINNGFICYYITASILNEKTGKLLIKTPPIYLNKVQIGCIRNDLKLAIAANASKEFGNYCFRKKNKVQVHIYVARKGYTQGETIPIEFHVINNSNHKINSNIILYQTKCFYCKNRQHIVEHHFQTTYCSPVQKGKDVKEIINLKIPDNCVLSFSSSIIIVNYFIICNVNITKSIDLHLNLPILITTHKSLNSSN